MATEGNAQGVGGGSKIDMNPKKSSFASLGVEARVVQGTLGARYSSAASALGGDRMRSGSNPAAKSAGGASKEMNSGGTERPSSGDGLYDPKSRPEGSLPARTSMTIGGGDSPSSGQYGGRTPNALQGTSTKAIQPNVGGYGGKSLTATGTLLRGAEVQGKIGRGGSRDGSGRNSD